MEKTSLRLDLPELESTKLAELQEQLKRHLRVTKISKVSTIHWIIRNTKVPTSEQTQEQ